MNSLWGNLIGMMIVIIMLTFVGIWIWAWRARHKPVFDLMANIPMQDTVNPDAENNELPVQVPEETQS